MDWNDVKSVVGKLAPTIAAGLGGPLAGSAVAALTAAFGLNPDASTKEQQEALTAAISGATPDQLLAIKKADQDYALAMQKAGFDNAAKLEELATTDRNSARKREVEVKDNTPKILAYAITVGFFSVLSSLMFMEMPVGTKEVLYIMLGTLGTAWGSVIAYFFGSTAGSSDKNKLLAGVTPAAATKK